MIHLGESMVVRENGTERGREILSGTTIENDSTEADGDITMTGVVKDTMGEDREMASIAPVKGIERTIVNVSP